MKELLLDCGYKEWKSGYFHKPIIENGVTLFYFQMVKMDGVYGVNVYSGFFQFKVNLPNVKDSQMLDFTLNRWFMTKNDPTIKDAEDYALSVFKKLEGISHG